MNREKSYKMKDNNRNRLYKIKENITKIVILAGIIAGTSYIVGRSAPEIKDYRPSTSAELVFSDVIQDENSLEKKAKENVQIKQAGFK